MENTLDIEKKALYNSLRLNWLLDSTLAVEAWQVDDYRSISKEKLFASLQEMGIGVDSTSFPIFAESVDTPEELTEVLFDDFEGDPLLQDQCYLLVFELWRRLIPEKQCLSIFCDELDQQISLYDSGELAESESIEDALSNFEVILGENVDAGAKPKEVFSSLSQGLANDIESFFYDFIADQIDHDNGKYASELLDTFVPFFEDSRWFDLLAVRLAASTDPESAEKQLEVLVRKAIRKQDPEYNLEMLAFLHQIGGQDLFTSLAKKTLPLLESEEEFQDFLGSCLAYYRCVDNEEKESQLHALLTSRKGVSLDADFSTDDAAVSTLNHTIF